jgi:formamidopyrimidine-DNA glycosylase
VEITARRLDVALRGAEIESAMAPGINALKTFDPPLHALDGAQIEAVRRIGKHLVVDVAGDLHVLIHLMSAGRLQLYDKRASLRDQQVIAGIGRTWVDEILHAAKLSPFKRGDDLSEREAATLRTAMAEELGRVLTIYEEKVALPLPEKFPKPTRVHAHQGEPCPRCETILEAVFYEDYVMTYCPHCQTEGRILKDRRLSRLLK